MEKNKIWIILLSILILIFIGFGIYGLLNYKTDNKKEYEIKILYYLDEIEEIEEIPKNTEEVLYKFDKYVCTNKITGTWDEDSWTFTPNVTTDGTCKLYFLSTKHDVTLNISNGALELNAVTLIEDGKDGTFLITPNEGYVFESSTCSNQEEIFWDEESNELTVKTIESDTTCAVMFKLNEFEVEIVVNNGKGATVLTSQYGQELTSSVTASSGYGNPKVTCTNSQTGTWTNNTFKIESVTNNTKCTVSFELTQTTPTLYTVSLTLNGHGSYPGPAQVISGGTAYFNIIPENGYKIGSISDCTNATFNDLLVTVSSVVKNTTCTVNMIPNE